MMLLKPTELREWSDLIETLRQAHSRLESAIDEYNSSLEAAKEELQGSIDIYNDVIGSLEEFRENTVSQMNDYYANRSEKWQESDKGDSYQDAISEWEDMAIEEIKINLPDPIHDDGAGELANLLDELPTETES